MERAVITAAEGASVSREMVVVPPARASDVMGTATEQGMEECLTISRTR